MFTDFIWFFKLKNKSYQEENSPKRKDWQIFNTHVNKVVEQLLHVQVYLHPRMFYLYISLGYSFILYKLSNACGTGVDRMFYR